MESEIRVQKGKSRLLNAVINGCSLNELIILGEQIVGYPFVLSTINHFVWYASADIPKDTAFSQSGGATAAPLFLTGGYKGFLDNDAPSYVMKGGPYQYCFCAMRGGSNLRGYSVMVGTRDFNDADTALHRSFCDILSEELEKTDATKRFLMLSDDEALLMNILEDAQYPYDYRDIGEMFPKGVRYMEIIAVRYREATGNYSPDITSVLELREILQCDICFGYYGKLVALAPVRTAANNRARLEAFMAKNGMYAGVSYPFNRLGSLNSYYEQAQTALSYCRGDESSLAFYSDYVFNDICNFVKGGILVNALCNYDIVQLSIYDKEHGTDYTRTLSTYIRSGYNSQKAASTLKIHRNSVLARMDKIRELVTDDDALSIDGYFSSFLPDLLEQ